MGINTPSDDVADLQIGVTDQGMVRLFITSGTIELPMDFTADDALDIAEEIREAAAAAQKAGKKRR